MSSFTKWVISTIITIFLVSGVIYAATIGSVISQTISSGDTMGAGWFQGVNNHIVSHPAGGITAATNSTCYAVCTTTCPAGYFRTACIVSNGPGGPSGAAGCSSSSSMAVATVYCAK